MPSDLYFLQEKTAFLEREVHRLKVAIQADGANREGTLCAKVLSGDYSMFLPPWNEVIHAE